MESSAYSLLVHSCEGITWNRRKAPNLYVVIQQDGQVVQRTSVVKRELTPTWQYLCNLSSDNPVALRLWHDSLLRCRDVCLGVVHTEIATLRVLKTSDSEFIKLQLTEEGQESKQKCTGILLVQLVQNIAAVNMAVDHAHRDTGKLTGPRLTALGEAPGVFNTSTSVPLTLEAGLGLLLVKLGAVVKIGDELAKIHPYANVAWKILTSVYQAVETQKNTDEKLCKLVNVMDSVYSFTKETDNLVQHLRSLEDKVLPIIKQTVECAIFIREYAGNGFATRAIRSTWDNADNTINELSETLLQLKNALESSLNVQGVFLSMQAVSLSTQVLQKIDSLVQSDTLNMLNPAKMNAASRSTCLKGTCVQLLNEITEWLLVPSGNSNILWLTGVAGSGKSTISTTISVSFSGLQRLGAFLFFDRNTPSHSHPDNVIHTLAYSLAQSSPHIGTAISAAIRRDLNALNSPLQTQFERLVLEPLQAVEHLIQGPILIILDALDECGDPNSRKNLLSIISTKFPKLPSVFRFLITSRREADLSDSFGTRFVEKSIATTASAKDVQLFIYHEVKRIRDNNKLDPEAWPKDSQMQAMIALAGGLFIWAATAIRFIDGYRPNERMKTLIGGKLTTLDALYTFTLSNSAPWDDTTFATDACAVLGCVVFSKVPMTDATIDMILGSSCRSSEVLKHLGCVIQWRPGCVARILHASFADYLTDVCCSKGQPWAIDPPFGHHILGLGCLRILNSDLKFNICGLEDSHILNANVPDLTTRVKKYISPPLSYSSCFWGTHIANCSFDPIILDDMTNFFHLHFLFWLEVLSLLRHVTMISTTLSAARNFVKGKDNDLEDLIIDTAKFVSAFAQLIAQSAPHIYLSAVPFSPRESKIAKQLDGWFPNTVGFDGSLGITWPAIQKVLHGHTGTVFDATLSPDGSQIASGSADKTVCVWDVETGVLVAGPFTGHARSVNSVHFSPDGTQIASGSDDRTVRIWDARTGTLVAPPFTGHTYAVFSVHFSPDGTQIASGSGDDTICVCDAKTGALAARPFTGHTDFVWSVQFSPDGTRIVSGSQDHTVRVWNAKTGVLAAGPFIGHTNLIRSVCFSPDGTQIASGSLDRTVCVWNAQTGDMVAGPLTGHTGMVKSVHFSPNGSRIASGAQDNIRVWDVQTGKTVAGPFTDHTARIGVDSVHFSLDGTQIVSGGDDSRVRIWDAQIGVLDDVPVAGHTRDINSVRFSPDGTRIASGGDDNKVYVWDASTGAIVAGPWISTAGWSGIPSVRFSPDSAWIASTTTKTISVCDSETGDLVAGPFEGLGSESVHESMTLSLDGRQIAACDSFAVCVWDVSTGALIAGPFNSTDYMTRFRCVDLSPDRTQIVAGCITLEAPSDNKIRIWDLETGTLAVALPSHSKNVLAVHFSPDGRRIASGSTDGTVHVWDARTGSLVAGPCTGHTGVVASVQFSPDGRHIASGSHDRTVRVWDAQTGALVAGPFTGHTGNVYSVHFSSDGARIASGSKDCTIRVCHLHDMNQAKASVKMVSSGQQFEHELVFDTDSGWIKDTAGALTLWIPPWLREGLYLPHNVLVIAARGTTKLNLSRFVHGTEWTECIDPKFRKSRRVEPVDA